MPFNFTLFEKELKLDNPTFERVLRSDLHELYILLKAGGFTTAQVAAEMKKVSKIKWTKYARTRAYLTREIMMLQDLLRAIPVDFTTTIMKSEMDDTILRHEFKWSSDTGELADLALVFTREHVTWGQWPEGLTACIGLPHGAEYTRPGSHTGLAANPANRGTGRDDHSLLGPFNQTILDYTGPAASASMDQVYEYSYDRNTWFPIAGSAYTIVREVSGPGTLKLTKTNKSKPADKSSIEKKF